MTATQQTRRVWRTDKAGDLRRLTLRRESLSALPAQHIRVRVHAVGLNFADIFALAGLYSATPEGSFIPGLEFAGEVVACGDRAGELVPGTRVYGCIRFGGYSDTVDVLPQHCRPLPADWSFAEGAAYPVQTLTAGYALQYLAAVRPGQQVLVHSAAGGVGLQAMRMCQVLGVNPIGTVRDARKAALLREQGFDEVIVRSGNFAAQLQRQLRGRALNAVLDGIGGAVQRASFEALAPTGRLVVFGAAEFTPAVHGAARIAWALRALWRYRQRPRYDVMEMISANKSVLAFNLIWLWQEQALFDELLDAGEGMHLPPPLVGHRFAFNEAHRAVECLRSGASTGKVVLEV